MTSYIDHLECTVCGKSYPHDQLIGVSPCCEKVLFARYDLHTQMTGAGSVVEWFFTSEPVSDYRSTQRTDLKLKARLGATLRNHGLFGGGGRFSSSIQHREKEMELTLEAVEAGLREIRN